MKVDYNYSSKEGEKKRGMSGEESLSPKKRLKAMVKND